MMLFLICSFSSHAAQWKEYSSDNFRLYTDSSEKEAKQTLIHAEQFRQVIGRFIDLSQDSLPVLNIMMYRSERDFLRVAPKSNDGSEVVAFGDYTYGGYSLVIGPPKFTMDRQNMIQHIYMGMSLKATDVKYPNWFVYGMREFFAVADIHNNKVTLGNQHERHTCFIVIGCTDSSDFKLTSVERLLIAEEDDYLNLQRESFFFMHYLLIGPMGKPPVPDYRESLVKYLALSEHAEVADSAFLDAFGKTPRELGMELDEYMRRSTKVTVSFPLEAYTKPIGMQPMADWESERLLAQIAFKKNDSVANKHIANAEKAMVRFGKESSDASTLARLADASKGMATMEGADQSRRRVWLMRTVEYGERSLAIDPALISVRRDVAAAYRMLGNTENSLQHLHRMHEQDPTDLNTIRWLGQLLGREGRYQEALPFLEEIARSEPNNSLILELLEEARQHMAADGEVPAEGSFRNH